MPNGSCSLLVVKYKLPQRGQLVYYGREENANLAAACGYYVHFHCSLMGVQCNVPDTHTRSLLSSLTPASPLENDLLRPLRQSLRLHES